MLAGFHSAGRHFSGRWKQIVADSPAQLRTLQAYYHQHTKHNVPAGAIVDTTVIEAISYLLTGFKVCSISKNSCLYCIPGQSPRARKSQALIAKECLLFC